MNHLDDDTLLQLVLEVLDDDQAREAEAHLAGCPACRSRWEKQQTDVALLSSVRVDSVSTSSRQTSRKRFITSSLLRAAALIVFGFLAGWMTSNFVSIRSIRVVPARVIVKSPANSPVRSAPADALAMKESKS